MNLEIVMGAERLAVNKDMVTIKKARELREKTKQIQKDWDKALEVQKKAVQEITDKYLPLLEREKDELDKDYRKRIQPVLDARQAEWDVAVPEDTESHIHTLAMEGITAIAQVFGQERKVNKETLDDTPLFDLKDKLAEFFLRCDCEFGALFLPRVPN